MVAKICLLFRRSTKPGCRILHLFKKDFSSASIRENLIYGKRKVPATVLRDILQKCSHLKDKHFGLYGAFGYGITNTVKRSDADDFTFFLPSRLVYFDDVQKQAYVKEIGEVSPKKTEIFIASPKKIYEDMSYGEFAEKVAYIVKEIRNGRLMQCVLSRNQGVSLSRHPLESYALLREKNPSPYSFFLSFGNAEYLYGASPEMHIKVKERNIEIRPIAGTSRRSSNPLEDAMLRIALQNNQKELREHMMLVDLARNELYELCSAKSVTVKDVLTPEVYPNLYHLVSGVTGRLRLGIDSLDALLTTIPAGTLSGAPKREAMDIISQLENSPRDYYGGAIGYLATNGDCNTGITIRCVHVKGGMSYVRAGAGIVAHSSPDGETSEIKLKSEKTLEVLQ